MSGRQRTLLNMFSQQRRRARNRLVPPQQGGPLELPPNTNEGRDAYNALFAEERRQAASNFARRRVEEREERVLNQQRNEGIRASQGRVLTERRNQGVNASQRRARRNRTNRRVNPPNNRGTNRRRGTKRMRSASPINSPQSQIIYVRNNGNSNRGNSNSNSNSNF